MKIRNLFAFCVLLLPISATAAGSLHIAAAADLVYCLEELNTAFQKAHPATLKVSTGSSGNFYAQIRNGAPFDVFLSADMKYPRELVKAGYADADSLTPYAVGRIVIWTLNPDIEVSRGMAALLDPGVRRIAIANPEHAPYGHAAQAAAAHYGLWDKIRGRLVLGENISQTAQFVQSGNADIGIVALSLVKSPKLAKVGRYSEIPLSSHPRMDQGGVITRKGATNPLAREYLNFLRSPEARAIFAKYGFLLPE